MKKQELATEIANWEEAFGYYLENYREAKRCRALVSEEVNFEKASQAASILTALKAMRS